MTSRKKGLSINLKGLAKQIAPVTAVVTNTPAPNNAPKSNSGRDCCTEAKAEKTSGAPLPNAKIVTPAIFCGNLQSKEPFLRQNDASCKEIH